MVRAHVDDCANFARTRQDECAKIARAQCAEKAHDAGMQIKTDTAWFERRREELDLGQEEIAAAVGKDRSVVSRMLNGRQPIKLEDIDALAGIFQATSAEIVLRAGLESIKGSIVNLDANFIEIEVRGDVQAGHWRQALEWPHDDRWTVHVPRPDRHKEYFGVIARGSSMDLIYPEGTILVCVPIGGYDHALRDGLRVIVERRDDCGMVEATIKELRQHPDGSVWLWPRSSDPLHQQPIPLPRPSRSEDSHAAGVADVRISAVVVTSVRPEEPAGNPIAWP